MMTTDGYFIASHTTNTLATDASTNEFDFRLKFLQFTNGYYTPGATLTRADGGDRYWTSTSAAMGRASTRFSRIHRR